VPRDGQIAESDFLAHIGISLLPEIGLFGSLDVKEVGSVFWDSQSRLASRRLRPFRINRINKRPGETMPCPSPRPCYYA